MEEMEEREMEKKMEMYYSKVHILTGSDIIPFEDRCDIKDLYC